MQRREVATTEVVMNGPHGARLIPREGEDQADHGGGERPGMRYRLLPDATLDGLLPWHVRRVPTHVEAIAQGARKGFKEWGGQDGFDALPGTAYVRREPVDLRGDDPRSIIWPPVVRCLAPPLEPPRQSI
jgi:hypothetical protein